MPNVGSFLIMEIVTTANNISSLGMEYRVKRFLLLDSTFVGIMLSPPSEQSKQNFLDLKICSLRPVYLGRVRNKSSSSLEECLR